MVENQAQILCHLSFGNLRVYDLIYFAVDEWFPNPAHPKVMVTYGDLKQSPNGLGPPSTSSESLVWEAQNLPGICQFVHAGDWLNRRFLGLLERVGGIGQRFENKTKEKFSRKKM